MIIDFFRKADPILIMSNLSHGYLLSTTKSFLHSQEISTPLDYVTLKIQTSKPVVPNLFALATPLSRILFYRGNAINLEPLIRFG